MAGRTDPNARARTPRSTTARRNLHASGLTVLLLVGGTTALYAPALHGDFVWDDDVYVRDNSVLTDPGGLGRIWFELGATPQYYPLVFTTFWVEHRLWGVDTLGYHLINVLLHSLGAILLWRMLRKLGIPGAWLAAALFAFHPVHVESVAWITERKNVLSGVFYLASMLAYCRFGLPEGKDLTRAPCWGCYALSILFYCLALCSKTVTCSLPVVLAILLWWQHPRFKWRLLAPLLPMFVIGFAMGMVTIWMENHNVGAQGPQWDLSFAERSIIAGRAVWFYLSKLAWPVPLMFVYPKWALEVADPAQYIFPASVAGLLLVLWIARRRIGKGPLVASLFFVVTLFPALGFINTFPMRYYFVADHFQYLASIGPIALVAAVLSGPLHRAWYSAMRDGTRRVAAVLPGALAWIPIIAPLTFLGTLTWRQAANYGDLETLYRDTLAKNPDAVLAHNNLGLLLGEKGMPMDALTHFQKAARVDPDFCEARYNMGTALSGLGRTAEAIRQYQEALRIEPDHQGALNNLGNTYLERGETNKALEYYARLLRINPRHADGRANMGIALARLGRLSDAVEEYRKAIDIDRNHIGAHYNLANALVALGRTNEAIDEYRTTLRLAPDLANAHFGLGSALERAGNRAEAKHSYQRALSLNPNDSEAREALARLR